jgi:hypothetical protein
MAALLIPSVGSEAVSDESSPEPGQNAYLIHSGLAAALVKSVMGVSLGSSNMNPSAPAGEMLQLVDDDEQFAWLLPRLRAGCQLKIRTANPQAENIKPNPKASMQYPGR